MSWQLFKTHRDAFLLLVKDEEYQFANSAKDKLVRLSENQFEELSTDVFDEAHRRETNDPPFLAVISSFHPKRNQARQKLATLHLNRFKELCNDVKNEIERRFPETLEEIPTNVSKVQPKATKSPESKEIRQNPALPLDLGASKLPIESLIPNLAPAQPVVDNNAAELKKNQQLINDLRHELEDTTKLLDDSQNRLKTLEKEYDSLQDDYDTQLQMNQDIRTEATNLLKEVKEATKNSNELRKERDKLKIKVNELDNRINSLNETHEMDQREINRLTELNQTLELKLKEMQKLIDAAASTSPKNTSRSSGNPNIDIENSMFFTGIYSADDILPYTLAVDQILHESREQKGPSPKVLIAMKAVVVACKTITEICEENEEDLDDKDSIQQVKGNLSKSLTGLMMIAKDVAANEGGESSYQRIYEGVCELTAVVTELVTTVNNLCEDHKDPIPMTLPQLRDFMGEQAETIVISIQRLLEVLRLPDAGDELTEIIENILSIVNRLLEASKQPLKENGMEEGLQILGDLKVSSEDLRSVVAKQSKQEIASKAYEIAKVRLYL